ncbi:formate dehydrogenase [Azohydromonas caseinilytica]|uniref:Formate dehydrogenase n=1 Tax=Azohydromonas caseinilytica TaxID=2728836 RepID=A0A848FAX5_9BURK|nr:formate dehydrogenase [Azohydromonas caseinilytica]NML15905.1 formate dehydrogenase [Azohydromonas caseinilytica]
MPLRLPRRNLLAAAACTPVAAVAALRGREAPPAPAAPVAEAQPPRPATYHETEHTRRYYRSAARL